MKKKLLIFVLLISSLTGVNVNAKELVFKHRDNYYTGKNFQELHFTKDGELWLNSGSRLHYLLKDEEDNSYYLESLTSSYYIRDIDFAEDDNYYAILSGTSLVKYNSYHNELKRVDGKFSTVKNLSVYYDSKMYTSYFNKTENYIEVYDKDLVKLNKIDLGTTKMNVDSFVPIKDKIFVAHNNYNSGYYSYISVYDYSGTLLEQFSVKAAYNDTFDSMMYVNDYLYATNPIRDENKVVVYKFNESLEVVKKVVLDSTMRHEMNNWSPGLQIVDDNILVTGYGLTILDYDLNVISNYKRFTNINGVTKFNNTYYTFGYAKTLEKDFLDMRFSNENEVVVQYEYKYDLTLKDSGESRYRVNRKNPRSGEEVIITLRTQMGYELDKILVTDSANNSVEVSKINDKKYSFVMPYDDTTVDVKFKKVS